MVQRSTVAFYPIFVELQRSKLIILFFFLSQIRLNLGRIFSPKLKASYRNIELHYMTTLEAIWTKITKTIWTYCLEFRQSKRLSIAY